MLSTFRFPFWTQRESRNCCKWRPTYQLPKSPKPQSSTNFEPNFFSVSILLKLRKNQYPSRKIWQVTSLWLKLRFFLHEIWALKQKKIKSLMLVELKYVKIPAIFARRYLLCILKDYFLKLATCTSKIAIAWFQKLANSFYFSTTTCESKNSLFL